jgi:hypothetical protein
VAEKNSGSGGDGAASTRSGLATGGCTVPTTSGLERDGRAAAQERSPRKRAAGVVRRPRGDAEHDPMSHVTVR